MATSEEHYEKLLAPVYSWMVGGAEQAFVIGAGDLDGYLPAGRTAVDLGCGFGMHTVPLARKGWTVVAIDSSASLVDELRHHARGLSVRAQQADLMDFAVHVSAEQKPELILCMGDTLTHLPSWQSVADLAQQVSSSLAPDGRFIATFRDYTNVPKGPRRFIPVRADASRILTCFLEEHADHVEVHDLLYTYVDGKWDLAVSSYRKLRLKPADIHDLFHRAGMRAEVTQGPRGMIRLVAEA